MAGKHLLWPGNTWCGLEIFGVACLDDLVMVIFRRPSDGGV